MKVNFVILSLFFTCVLRLHAAEVKIPTADSYMSGRALCGANANIIAHEKGFFVSAPLDPQNPKSGEFELYAWFQGEYDAHRPTVIYLTGGPGQTSHWGQAAFSGNFNVLMMDQRGVGCSRPKTYREYMNPQFYSSRNVAADMEVLRRHLKIDRWSIYGVSYGTIPATIYASTYPEAVIAVVLEGVAYDAKALWTQVHTRELIVNAVNDMSSAPRSRIQNLHLYGVETSWFFNWARSLLMNNEGLSELKSTLNRLSDQTNFENFVEMLKVQFAPQEDGPRNELFLLNEVPYFMLACQELGIQMIPTELQWSRTGQAIPHVNAEVLGSCKRLNLLSPLNQKLYSAKDYPIQKPVVYFQGENDSATEASGAWAHWQNSAQGVKQFFLLQNGGHNPNLVLLTLQNPGQSQLLENAIYGKMSSEKDVSEANRELSGLKWIAK